MRYVWRPPPATERLRILDNELVRLELKKPFSDGTVAVELDPLSLLWRLCAAVPPPRRHTIVYSTRRQRGFANLSPEADACALLRVEQHIHCVVDRTVPIHDRNHASDERNAPTEQHW